MSELIFFQSRHGVHESSTRMPGVRDTAESAVTNTAIGRQDR